MEKINRDYSKVLLNITFNTDDLEKRKSTKINILYSKGTSDYTLLVLPQGVRDAEYIKSTYQVFLKYFNVILFDPPGLGESESIEKYTNLNNISKIVLELFKNNYLEIETGIKLTKEKTVLIGKSLFSPIVENILEYEDNFYATIITAGPIILSKISAAILRIHFWLGSKFYLIREISYKIIQLLNSYSDIKVSYYDWRIADYWYNWVSIFTKRIKEKYTTHKTPTTLILNGKDELVPESNIKLAKQIFTNLTIHKLPTRSHWGPICEEELKLIRKTLTKIKQNTNKSKLNN